MTRQDAPLLGVYGGLTSEAAGVARDVGMNAVWFHMFQEEQFAICARAGLAPCVELKTFRVDFAKRPDLVPIGVDGRPIRYGSLVQGLCLSHPDVIDEIETQIDRGMRAFRPSGVWLDYLSYAGWFETPRPDLQESCFCAACLGHFRESTGIDAATPAGILRVHADAWTRHKCERIAALGRRFADRIRSHTADCLIGVYLCPWRPEEHDGALTRIFAQDPALLAPAVDVYTPLIYVEKSGRATGWGREYLEMSSGFLPPDRRVQLILDAQDLPGSLTETAASRVPTWGVQIFGGARLLDDPAARRTLAVDLARLRP